eukprot:TRINITY_DN11987_c0_g1_i1.p1 TRINITY_DN11987_c0_g1~~TRINITY_DN11987_c0_g1_i1.p1  ORF type:complete len:249 (-),score=31.84 TRINITY_DN11987_c0_g1_i1:146-865(-)
MSVQNTKISLMFFFLLVCSVNCLGDDPPRPAESDHAEKSLLEEAHAIIGAFEVPSDNESSSNESSAVSNFTWPYPIGDVVEVTTDELLKILSSDENRTHLVQFYAKWCPFSMELRPVYDAVAKAFPGLGVMAVDGAKYSNLNSRYSVHGFPRIFAINSHNYTRYLGNRTYDSLVDFVRQQTRIEPLPGVEPVFPPPGRPTPEADIYLYLASAALFGLFCYSVYTLVVTRSAKDATLKQD